MNSDLPAVEPSQSNAAARWMARAWPRWAMVAGWMALIYFFSAQSSFGVLDRAWQIDLISLAAHFAEYALLAALLWLALRSTPPLAQRATSLAFVVAVLYAVSDELHQYFVPGRYADPRDVIVDVLGVGFALWLARRLARQSTLVI